MGDGPTPRPPCTSTTLAAIRAGIRSVHDLNQREVDAFIAALKRARGLTKPGA